MNKKIKFGIIGCSQIADSSSIPAILKSKNAQIEMIGSRSQSKAKKFSVKFCCKNYGTYDEVLENDKVDAVYISVPVGLHKEWSIKAAKAGKHILCEKSSSSSYLDSQRMINEAKKNEVRIMEGFMFRFHPSHKKVKQLINSKSFGKTYSFFSRYGFPSPPQNNIRFKKELGGGILNDAGCYPICASRIIFGKEPIGVLCQSTLDKNGIDTKTIIYLKFGKEQFAQMITGYELFYQSSYSIWGSKGFLKLSRSYNIPENMKAVISLNGPENEKKILIHPVNHFKLMIESFSKEITTRNSCDFNFEDDLLKQAKIMESCRISFKKNKFVELEN
jgi:D-xylose 1-dehydrogenase (NADP+, D-xylono-1,5-lactone-forming)